MKTPVRLLLVTIVALSLQNVVFSQESKVDTVTTIITKRIIPSVKKYIQYSEMKNGRIAFQSILTREIKKTTYQEKDAYLIIQKYQSEKSIDLDSSYVYSSNLKPMIYHTNIQSGGYQEIVEFSKNKIFNKIIYKDSISESTKVNNNYYNGVIMDDIISELPLAEGKKFIIKAVNPGKRHFKYMAIISVVGIETIEINPSLKIKCWKLNVGNTDNNRAATQWYSVEGQHQIKTLFEFKGGKFVRTMITG